MSKPLSKLQLLELVEKLQAQLAAPAPPAPPVDDGHVHAHGAPCPACDGTGNYVFPDGNIGICYRCEGSGVVTPERARKNRHFDKMSKMRAAVAADGGDGTSWATLRDIPVSRRAGHRPVEIDGRWHLLSNAAIAAS